jgi:hypothetical protein
MLVPRRQAAFASPRGLACVLALTAALVLAPAPSPARALSLKPICGLTGLASGLLGKACSVATNPGRLLGAGRKALSGHISDAINTLAGGGAGAKAATIVSLAAVGAWVAGGAKFVLGETAKLLSHSSSPQLGATWFSASYWRIAGIAALLTLPFLFAAAIQALLRSDLGLLGQAAFGYLPLAMLAVSIAAPLTMLLLAAADEMSALASAASAGSGVSFLARAGAAAGVADVFARAPFVTFLVGVLTVSAALLLWLELLIRQAAVYVIVLMLPLAFSAMVWPARRIWVIRSVEVLVALILAKFAIVAVLALGGAALAHPLGSGVFSALAGAVLVILGAFAPWVLLRLLPLAELASGAASSLSGEGRGLVKAAGRESGQDGRAHVWAERAGAWLPGMTARMRRDAEDVGETSGESRTPPGETGSLGTPDAPSDRLDQHLRPTTNGGDPTVGDPPGGAGGAAAGAAIALAGAGPGASHGAAAEAPDRSAPPGPGDEGSPVPHRPWADPDWGFVLGIPGDPPRARRSPGVDGGGGEHHDPLPPSQEPDDGRL